MSSYIINKTDGSILAVLEDGNIDNTSCSLSLVGKNTSNYGEPVAENLVKLMEHFANSVPPLAPLPGQLWFDTNTKEIMLFTGSVWSSLNPTSYYSTSSNTSGSGSIDIENDAPLSLGSSTKLSFETSSGTVTMKVGPRINQMSPILQFDQLRNEVLLLSDGTSNNSLVTKSYVDNKSFISSNQSSISITPETMTIRISGLPIMTGDSQILEFSTVLKAVTPAIGSIDNSVATTQFVRSSLNNAVLSGEPTTADPNPFDNSNRVATTRFVQQQKHNTELTGSPVAPTPINSNVSERIATTRFVDDRITLRFNNPAFTGSATSTTPPTSDTSSRIATTEFVSAALNAFRLNPVFSGVPRSTNPNATDSSDQIATTRFVQQQKVSPAFTGTPTSQTPEVSDVSDRIATTKYVDDRVTARLNNAVLTGSPTSTSPVLTDVSDRVATTRFVNQLFQQGSDRWGGSRKFISRQMPDPSVGSDGDFWFRIE